MNADDSTNEADTYVPPVTSDTTDALSGAVRSAMRSATAGPSDTQKPEPAPSPSTRPGPGSDFPKDSSKSDAPSDTSTPFWPEPQTAMEFAAQARSVATMVLNNGIDIDVARLYSAVARTVAQALSVEVTRSRFLRREPDLRFPKLKEPK